MNAQPANPSAWKHRAIVLALALIGCAIATYLSLYQWRVISHVFEPFFGNGSEQVLRQSPISRNMPFPDAFLGALAYAAEAILVWIGDEDRWRDRPRTVALYGLTSIGLAVVAIFLLFSQPMLAHGWCTLCLCSAAISITVAILASGEIAAVIPVLLLKWQHHQ